MPTALVGCRTYVEAGRPAIDEATVLIVDGRIGAIGPRAQLSLPPGTRKLDCRGTIVPGFWNSHVHFTEPKWSNAASAPVAALEKQLSEMLSSYGFVHVIDTGSDLANTTALRGRIASGVVRGPSIRTAGAPFVAPGGTPFYVEDFKFPEMIDAAQAAQVARTHFDQGADAIKLMTVSLTRAQPFPAIALGAVRAASEEAHRRGRPVLAHPTNALGVSLALQGGVDVLLHTAPIGGSWDSGLVRAMVDADMSLTPTLMLWDFEARRTNDPEMEAHFRKISAQQLKAFAAAGGRVLFGTDVGYMPIYDPTAEYVAMGAAGLSFPQILASLTSAPAAVFAPNEGRGRLGAGSAADLVILDGDPADDIKALVRVRQTYRDGRLIYTSEDRR